MATSDHIDDVPDRASLIESWITTEGTFAVRTKLKFGWETGEPDEASVEACLSRVIEPLFSAAGFLNVLGSKLKSESLGGEGRLILDVAEKVSTGHLKVPYAPGLVPQLRRFFLNEANSSIAIDLRGAVSFSVTIAQLEAVLPDLGEPYVLKNYRSVLWAGALRSLRQALDPQRLNVALTDRLSLTGIYLFGCTSAFSRVLKAASHASGNLTMR